MHSNRKLEAAVGLFIVLGFLAALFMALIVFDPETFQARVVMDMDARYPFPDDSSAKILTAGLLGEQYVGIEAGADEANLVEGSKIRRTQSAVVLENLISQFLYSKAEDGGK